MNPKPQPSRECARESACMRQARKGSGGTRFFGSYVEAWQGWAVDPEFRHAGSSGGVLTALSCWLMSSGRAREVAGCGMSAIQPTRTVPLRITSREEALAAAGSRYAPPVSNSLSGQNCEAFIGKPCEVSGRRRLASNTASAHGQSPVLLSFFLRGGDAKSTCHGGPGKGTWGGGTERRHQP